MEGELEIMSVFYFLQSLLLVLISQGYLGN